MEQNVIEFFPGEKWRIVKTLKISASSHSEFHSDIYLYYGRKMHDTYKIHPQEKSVIERCIHGYCEDEYPSDEVDDFIKNTLAKSLDVSIDSVEVRSSLLANKTSLQQLQNSVKGKQQIMIEVQYELNPVLWEKQFTENKNLITYSQKMIGFTFMPVTAVDNLKLYGCIYYQDCVKAKKLMDKVNQEVDWNILD